MHYMVKFESRFPLQTPRSNAGRFCLWGRGGNLSGGWEPGFLYILDNQTLLNHLVPNLAFFKGVGNHVPRNTRIINHL